MNDAMETDPERESEGSNEAPSQRSPARLFHVRTWPRWMLAVLFLAGLTGLTIGAWHTRSYVAGRTTGAVGTLRSLVSANEQFKQCGCVDQDADGWGEYGWLGEMAGVDPVRCTGLKMSTSPFIATKLGMKDGRGRARLRGYVFHLALPFESNRWRLEPKVIPPAPWPIKEQARADSQEKRWLCYAWPAGDNIGVRSVYFLTESGEIWVTNGGGKQYRGDDGPRVSAAFVKGGQGPPGGAQAPSYTGTDGNTWTLLDQ
jgi:hypothetical protein